MEINEAIVVPVIISLVELAKGLGLPKKFSAIAAVLIGAIIGVFYIEPHSIKFGLLKGVIYGLTASGLYSGAKNTVQQMRTKNHMDENKKET